MRIEVLPVFVGEEQLKGSEFQNGAKFSTAVFH